MNRHNKTLLWFSVLLGVAGCDLPSPPPDMLYKFDVMQVGKGPAFLLTQDINLDGEPDLISVNAKDNSLSLLYGKGDGTFHSARNIQVGAEPTMVAAGDVNRDGILDLVVNARGAEMFIVLPGNGDGSFRRPIPIKTGKVPLNVILADFNNDEKLDAAVTLTFDQMEIYIGSGDGYFHKRETYLTGSRSFSGVTGDFNG
ncbi:MAG: VCBS repeat-containing protein, partial [Nitrospinae bacterium]|nr:VCBS repeat-containing protein [Nitrospinota bacterium]